MICFFLLYTRILPLHPLDSFQLIFQNNSFNTGTAAAATVIYYRNPKPLSLIITYNRN